MSTRTSGGRLRQSRKAGAIRPGNSGQTSAAATWTTSFEVLIAARAVMGLGGAMILPVAFAVLPALFPPAERGKAVALVVLGTGLGIPLGPLIGGWLLENATGQRPGPVRHRPRLLPLIGGLVVGAPTGERLAARTRYRVPVTAGLLILAAGLAVGAGTDANSGFGFVAGWMAAVGLGIGLALSPAMDAVLGALPPDRAGAGTAITMTLRQVGGALGVALLGSLVAQGYTNRLDTTGLPATAADTARDSIAAALAVAASSASPALADSAKTAYLHGMTIVLYTAATIAALSAILTAALLPGRPTTDDGAAPQPADPAPTASRSDRDTDEPAH